MEKFVSLNKKELGKVVGGKRNQWNGIKKNLICNGGTVLGAVAGGILSAGNPAAEVAGALGARGALCF